MQKAKGSIPLVPTKQHSVSSVVELGLYTAQVGSSNLSRSTTSPRRRRVPVKPGRQSARTYEARVCRHSVRIVGFWATSSNWESAAFALRRLSVRVRRGPPSCRKAQRSEVRVWRRRSAGHKATPRVRDAGPVTNFPGMDSTPRRLRPQVAGGCEAHCPGPIRGCSQVGKALDWQSMTVGSNPTSSTSCSAYMRA